MANLSGCLVKQFIKSLKLWISLQKADGNRKELLPHFNSSDEQMNPECGASERFCVFRIFENKQNIVEQSSDPAMRRSERASRKPDFLTFPDQGRARPATIDEESESDAESEESDIPQPLDTVKKSQKAPAPSHVTTAISGGKRKRTKIVATGKLDMTLEGSRTGFVSKPSLKFICIFFEC